MYLKNNILLKFRDYTFQTIFNNYNLYQNQKRNNIWIIKLLSMDRNGEVCQTKPNSFKNGSRKEPSKSLTHTVSRLIDVIVYNAQHESPIRSRFKSY